METTSERMKGKEDVDVTPVGGETMNLSLFELAYGKQVQALANGSSTRPFVSAAELLGDERPFPIPKLWRASRTKQKLNVSVESGSWMLKVQRASIPKGEVHAVSSSEHVDSFSEAIPLSQRQHIVLRAPIIYAGQSSLALLLPAAQQISFISRSFRAERPHSPEQPVA